MKVAVIGASGFIGRSLVTRLAADGFHVNALSRSWKGLETDVRADSATLFEGDAAETDAIRPVTRGCSAAYFLAYHGVPLLDGADHLVEYEANLRMLVTTMAAAAYGGVERFILMSSGGTVYGEVEDRATEDANLQPISHYGTVKKISEQLLIHYTALSGSFSYSIARVANPFGPGQVQAKRRGLVVSAMLRAVAGEPVLVHDEGRQVRDYIYIDDAVRALTALARSNQVHNQVFNIGSGVGRSISEVVADVERVSGKALQRQYVPGRQQDVNRSVLSVDKINDVVGQIEQVGYEEGLSRTWATVAQEP